MSNIFRRWASDAKAVLTGPRDFYHLARNADLSDSLGFVAIANLCYGLIVGVLALVGGLVSGEVGEMALFIAVVPVMMIASVIGGVLTVLLGSAAIHVVAYLLGARGYSKTVAAVSYATAVEPFLAIPVLNLPAIVYKLYLQYIGIRVAHDFSRIRAIVSILLIPILLLALAVAAIFVVVSMGPGVPVDGVSPGTGLSSDSPFNQCQKITPRFTGQEVAISSWDWTGTDSMSMTFQAINDDVTVTSVSFDWNSDGDFTDSADDVIDVDDTPVSAGQTNTTTISRLSTSSGECASGTVRITLNQGSSTDLIATGSGPLSGIVP